MMNRQKIEIAYSPCPNDTFIFHHLIKHGTERLDFQVAHEDVAELNRRALEEQRHAITKLSFFTMSRLQNHYRLLDCGGALGRGCGPLWISNAPRDTASCIKEARRIMVPGAYTTANLLLHLYLTEQGRDWREIEFIPTRYDRIMPMLKAGQADLGLIIHEERFTFQKLGLHQLCDLGQWWEDTTGHPIPLGCIAVRHDIDKDLQAEIEAGIRHSLKITRQQPEQAWPYIKEHAQALEDDVIQAHIDLYVNDYSMAYGQDGQAAIKELFKRADSAGLS